MIDELAASGHVLADSRAAKELVALLSSETTRELRRRAGFEF
jgi:hypothetical protein